MATLDRFNTRRKFTVKKARLVGSLPGYDDKWMRNVDIAFLQPPPGSQECLLSPWWLAISAENESRWEIVPFQPVERKVIVESSQLQVRLDGKREPKSDNRLSDMKIGDDNVEILQQMRDFILIRVCDRQPDPQWAPSSSGGPVRASNFPQQVAVGYEDKENMSSGLSTASSTGSDRQRVFAKQSISGTGSGGGAVPATARPVPAANFYGKTTASVQYNSEFRYNPPQPHPKPTQSLGQLRENHLTSSKTSPPPSTKSNTPVGSQGRPIPTMVRGESSNGTRPASASNTKQPFTAYGSKIAKENSPNRPIVSTNGRTNPMGSNGPYMSHRESPFGKPSATRLNSSASAADEYEFHDENDENNDYKDAFRMSPIELQSSSVNDFSTNAGNNSSTTVARTRSSSPIGLLNLGNSCYMNAVLQALFAQPSFNYDLQRISEDDFIQLTSEFLREKELEKGQSSTDLVSVAQRNKQASETSLILCVLNLLRSCSANPADTLDRQKSRLLAVKAASKKFTDSQQHDAQEFLCCVLDDLKEEHRHGFTAMKTAVGAYSDESEMEKAELFANPVAANFDFTLRKSLSCRQCDRVASEQVESFNNLSVHIPNAEASVAALQHKHDQLKKSPRPPQNHPRNDDDLELPEIENVAPLENNSSNINKASTSSALMDLDGMSSPPPPAELSLQDCIDHFFQKEEIQYRSEQCGHDFGGVVSYCLASLPRVFVIHLKRFLYTMTSNVGTKCTLPVTIPPELDLSKYCAQKDVVFPKLVDSPLAPKEALRSQILSPAKFSPTSSTPPRICVPINKCRKRIFSEDSSPKDSQKQCENDENVPISAGATKRSRSTTGSSEKNIAGGENGKANSSATGIAAGFIPDSAPSSESSNESSQNSDRNNSAEFQQYTKYRLSAIISHTGSSSDYGHYTTDAYHSTLKRWFRFDDMAVKNISETNVLEENKWNGYIFFYTAAPVWEQAVANSFIPTPSNNNFSNVSKNS